MKHILKKISFLILFTISLNVEAAFINDKAPDFNIPNLSGDLVTLSEYKGDVVFINFWASWCPPCKKEFPELNELAAEFKDEKFTLLAINLDKSEKQIRDYLKKIEIPEPAMTILMDPHSKVVASYVARSMPTSFIVDREGIIRFVHFGYSPKDPGKWRKEIKSLLEKK